MRDQFIRQEKWQSNVDGSSPCARSQIEANVAQVVNSRRTCRNGLSKPQIPGAHRRLRKRAHRAAPKCTGPVPELLGSRDKSSGLLAAMRLGVCFSLKNRLFPTATLIVFSLLCPGQTLSQDDGTR